MTRPSERRRNPTRERQPVGTWEVDDFFRDLRRTVVALEEAHRRGTLARRLEEFEPRPEAHPAVLASYRRLLRGRPLPIAAYRERAVHALLDQAKRELFNTDVRFDARPVHFARQRRGGVPRGALEDLRAFGPGDAGALQGLAVRSRRGEVYLRLDQVCSMRTWGIGFLIDEAELSDRVTTFCAHTTAERLGYALMGVEKVQRRLVKRGIEGELDLIPPPDGRRFEALFLDILNEHYPCARHAPLWEDFFEKTDLRLHTRGLERRRGARAQVTRTVDPFRHAEKLAQIHAVDEFVVLSPLTLARALCDYSHELGLSQEDVLLFWHCFPDPPTTAEELGRAIRERLLHALSRPCAGPRGPASAVPEPLRLLIQSYARSDSFRATARLRQRLASEAARNAG